MSDGAPLLSLLVVVLRGVRAKATGSTKEDAGYLLLIEDTLSVEFCLDAFLSFLLLFRVRGLCIKLLLFSNGFCLVVALVVTGTILLSQISD